MGVICWKNSIIKKNPIKNNDNIAVEQKNNLNNSFDKKTTSDKKEEPPEELKRQEKTKMIVSIDENVIVTKGEVNPREIYFREKTLGQGSFGTVYLVKHIQLQRYFAMKVIKKKAKNHSEEESLMNEINILRKLDII